MEYKKDIYLAYVYIGYEESVNDGIGTVGWDTKLLDVIPPEMD